MDVANSLNSMLNYHSFFAVLAGLAKTYTPEHKALWDKIPDQITTWLKQSVRFCAQDIESLRTFFRTKPESPCIPIFHIFYDWIRENENSLGHLKLSPKLLNIKRISSDYRIYNLLERGRKEKYEITPSLQILAYLKSPFVEISNKQIRLNPNF